MAAAIDVAPGGGEVKEKGRQVCAGAAAAEVLRAWRRNAPFRPADSQAVGESPRFSEPEGWKNWAEL